MRIISKATPYIIAATVAVLGLTVLLLTAMTVSGNTPEPTAVPKIATSTPEPKSTYAPPAPKTTPQPVRTTPAPVAEPYTPDPTVTQAPEEDTTAPDTSTSIIDAEGMQGDDYVIYLVTTAEANATQTHAPSVLAAKIDELTGTPQAEDIDLVAVYSADGVMVASDRIPGGK